MDEPEETIQVEAEPEEKKSPALTIVIQSWATPILGVVMLILGAVGGFFLRPLVLPESTPLAPASQEESSSASPTQETANIDPAQIMKLVADQTRHFAGPDDASVTIIEFSDYQ